MAPSDPQQNAHDEAASKSDSRLLSLPAELRNRVYRLVLLENRPIRVTQSGFDQGGGLLSTCKQIRQEALKIYYYENKFLVITPKWNTDTLVSFHTETLRLQLRVGPYGVRCNLASTSQEPHWANLLEWARRLHSRELSWWSSNEDGYTLSGTRGTVAFNVCRAMRIMACEMRAMPWSQVKEVLAPQRIVLASVDKRWLEEKEVGEE